MKYIKSWICYIHGINMHCITAIITLALAVLARLTFAEQTTPLRCYICVTDYEDSTQDPGCSISNPNVLIRACAVQHGFDRCISYRARNSKTGNAVFRRHCATREMCEYQCLFSHHTNCEKACCHGDLCNDVSFGGYERTTGKPALSSTKKYPQNPTTTPTSATPSPTTPPTSAPIKTSQSTPNPTVTQTTTDAPVTTQKVSTTEGSLVGGPPTRPGCQDYREKCAEYAAYPGYCQYTRAFMLLNCPWSCRFCVDGGTTTKSPQSATTTSPISQSVRTTSNGGNGGVGGPAGCVDARVRCAHFANFDGYCEYHRGFMLTYCPRSCNFCDDVQLPESPVRITEKPTTNKPKINVDDLFGPKPTPFGPGGEEYEIDLNNGCIDLRENCTYYARTYDDYCNYNQEFMEIYCPFSCGFCGTSVLREAFPHPPVIHQHPVPDEEFPPPPTKKDVKWLTSFCSKCRNGLQECIPKCILLLNDGNYEPTSNDVCLQLLGKPNEIMPC